MRKEKVTFDVFKQYLDLIEYSLIKNTDSKNTKEHSVIDNLGKETGLMVDDEQVWFDINDGISIYFFFTDCWLETIDNDGISLTSKQENSGIFINIVKQKKKK